jgi:arylsulfatase A-like enzyme
LGNYDAALILGYAWLSYGAVSAAVAATLVRIATRTTGVQNAAAFATGVAIAVAITVWQVRALAAYRNLDLAWLAIACAALGIALGMAVGRCVAFFSASQVSSAWGVATVAALGFALTSTFTNAPSTATGVPNPDTSAPNVLLVSVDTLRIDRLGCYGAVPTRTPRLDALAEESVLFENVVAPVALTGPSHATMLTGLYPNEHGITINGMPIADDVDTVAEALAREGYATAAFVSGWPLTDASSKLASRFQIYDQDFSTTWLLPDVAMNLALTKLSVFALELATGRRIEPNERAGSSTVENALEWISHRDDRPFFAFVHLYEPHAPYAPPPDYARKLDPDYRGSMQAYRPYELSTESVAAILSDPREVEHIIALYDAEAAYTDELVGRLLDGLETTGAAEDTLVIFTADHGESMTEHGTYFDHDEFLYDVYVRVPLLLHFPAAEHAGTRRKEQVRLIDLAPTILEVTGAEMAATLDGSSLVGAASGGEEAGERVAFGSISAGSDESARSRHYVRSRGYKLIWNFDRRQVFDDRPAFEELYDLSEDPGELDNLMLTGRPPDAVIELRALLAEHVRRRLSNDVELDAEVRRRLQSLGYL